MKEKKLLIVERCNNNLNIIEEQLEGHSEKSIILSGVFTTFDQKNRNGRIYESADFLPHVESLKEAIKHRALLGEMDHPHSFETTLANASHVIESLEFDPAQNAIIGRIRLLNTSRGRDAQALVRDGIPLHISSRAAGTVNESGKVRLQQLFTYDLVAEPGFANAVLTQVNEGVNHSSISDDSKNILIALNESHKPNLNESYGITDEDGIEIYEVSEDASLTPKVAQEGQKTTDFGNEQAAKTVGGAASTGTIADQNGFVKPEPINVNTNNNNNMDNGQYILYSDFQKYSEHLSEIITDLQNAISNYKAELTNIKDTSKPTETFDASNVDNTMISNLIAQQVAAAVEKIAPAVPAEGDNSENIADDVKAKMEEKYNNLETYVKYLSEQLDKTITHQDYIAEEANKMIKHQDYLAENMNKMIEHQDYLAENLNDTIGYQNYVAEMLDKSIDYSNMLAEEQNKTVAYNNYLSEKMNQMVSHQDYLAENMNNMISHQDYIVESINGNKENNTGKNVVEENTTTNNTNKNTTEVFNSKEYQNALSEKLSSLIQTVKTQYEEAKKLEAEAIEESRKSCVDEKNFNLINYLPARLNERWSKLSDTRKQEILAESKMFVINNAKSAEYFWNTRDLREKQIVLEKLEEEKTAQTNKPLNENIMTDDRYKAMMEQIKSRMRKY